MKSIVIDSGPLIALFDRSDDWHQLAISFLSGKPGRLITNLPVITEVTYMLDFSPATQRDFLGWAEQALNIDQHTVDDLPRIRTVLEKYQDLPADFADASLVALCERLGHFDVASVDKDFSVYRSQSKRYFNNLFFNSHNPP